MPASAVYAGVAEASTGVEPVYTQQYDLSGLTAEEKQWFEKFLVGTFYADGWEKISSDILVKISAEDREEKKSVLNRLGYKIGLEWCKDNEIRKVDTAMLKKWGQLLRLTAEEEPHLLAKVIEDIDEEVTLLVD
jgi:hypothetical protein